MGFYTFSFCLVLLVFGGNVFCASLCDFHLGNFCSGQFNAAEKLICVVDHILVMLIEPPVTRHELYYNVCTGEAGNIYRNLCSSMSTTEIQGVCLETQE